MRRSTDQGVKTCVCFVGGVVLECLSGVCAYYVLTVPGAAGGNYLVAESARCFLFFHL